MPHLSLRRRHGQSTVEMAIIIALVAAVAMLGLRLTGVRLDQIFCRVVSVFGGSCGALFSENFDDLDGWKVDSGKWDLVDGELCGGPGEGKILAPVSAENYTIDLDTARLTQGNGYGVLFRTQPTARVNGYSFQYDPGMQGFVIRKWVNGNEISQPMAWNKVPNYDWYGEDRKVQLTVDGDTFTVTVDGEPVIKTSDNTYPTGGVGLRTWDNTRSCFDDLSVHSLR